jgi:hypothetical protein
MYLNNFILIIYMADNYDVLYSVRDDGSYERYERIGIVNSAFNLFKPLTGYSKTLTGDSVYESDYNNTKTLSELVNSKFTLLRYIPDEKGQYSYRIVDKDKLRELAKIPPKVILEQGGKRKTKKRRRNKRRSTRKHRRR